MISDQECGLAGRQLVRQRALGGIEQEGFAVARATWFTEPLYHSSAKLVTYLAAKYDVKLDRAQHHRPRTLQGPGHRGTVAGMHWESGARSGTGTTS